MDMPRPLRPTVARTVLFRSSPLAGRRMTPQEYLFHHTMDVTRRAPRLGNDPVDARGQAAQTRRWVVIS